MNPRFCMGRTRPSRPARDHLSLKHVLTRRLPAPPPSVDYSAEALASLSDVMKNDVLGCCVVSALNHFEGEATGNAGQCWVASDAQIVGDYSAIGGYVPGDPSTDQGCDEQTAFTYYKGHGFGDGTRLVDWLAVDATKPAQVKQAIFNFENAVFGIELPGAWLPGDSFDNGFVWDVAGPANPDNGHAFLGVGYDPVKGVKVWSWGLWGWITWPAIAKYAVPAAGGELYTLLSASIINKVNGNAPDGMNWPASVAAWDVLGGSVPVPPSPTPVPAPTPAPAPDSKAVLVVNLEHRFVASTAGVPVTFGGNGPITVDPVTGAATAPAGWTTFNFTPSAAKRLPKLPRVTRRRGPDPS